MKHLFEMIMDDYFEMGVCWKYVNIFLEGVADYIFHIFALGALRALRCNGERAPLP